MSKKGKVLEAIISIAGQIDPSLQTSISNATKQFSGLKVGIAAIGTATLAATTAIAGFGAGACKSAAEFETQIANVATLLDGTKEQVAQRTAELGDDVLSVSNATGIATGELNDGLYQIISAVGDSEDAIMQMELAAKGAAAGGAETTDAINLLTAVTKGYGDTSGEAFQKASDLSFMTVKLGQTSFPELASSMGKVVPLASALNVSQEELYGSFAALTGVTGSTAEVATQMKAVMSGLMSPTDTMTKALKSLGYENANAALESLGLQGTLDVLGQTVGGDTQALAKMFSSVEAQTAILALAGAQSEDFTKKTAEMYDAAGATDRAFATQTDTLEYTIKSIKNLGSNFMTSVGQEILPYAKDAAQKALPEIQNAVETLAPKVADFLKNTISGAGDFYNYARQNIIPVISDVVEFVSGDVIPLISSVSGYANEKILPIIAEIAKAGIDGFGMLVDIGTDVYDTAASIFGYLEEHKGVLTVIASVVGILAGAIIAYTVASNAAAIASGVQAAAIATYTTVTGIATAATTAFGAVVGFLTSPITRYAVVIGILIAAGVALYKNWDTVKAYALNLWDTLCQFASGVKDAFVSGFSGLVGIVSQPINAIISLVNGAIGAINSIGFTIPDWVPMLGGKTFALNIPPIPMLASGGFTTGPSIAGEAGMEAVISFDSAYREDNLSYWAKAGRMLGVDEGILTAFERKESLGGGNINIKFAPHIVVNGTGSVKEDIINALRMEEDEFIDMLMEMLDRRGGEEYAFDG